MAIAPYTQKNVHEVMIYFGCVNMSRRHATIAKAQSAETKQIVMFCIKRIRVFV